MLAFLVSYVGGMATFAQVLLALPMALDLLGPPSFLLLSLLFTLHHTVYSSLRLLLKNTVLAPTITILSLLSPAITTLLILFTLYTYLHPPSDGSGHVFGASAGHVLVDVLPYLYASVLRWVSPMFTLLEGISTLLVVQVLGRMGRDWADDDEKEEGLEWRSIVGLVAAALLYCAGLAWLVWAFPPNSTSSISAFLLGCAITSVLFLSLIGFSLRRTNVLETSLVFLYVVYSAWLSGAESRLEPRQFGSGWLSRDWAQPKYVSEGTVNELAHRAVSGVVDSLSAVSLNLPPHLLLSLIFRVVVMHSAARIVPNIRKASMGWDDPVEDVTPGFWDGRSLTQEPPNVRVTTVVLAYRRAILIAVYTHLLLLDGGSQMWWRWINIALFLCVWSLELTLDADDDTESVTRWKVD